MLNIVKRAILASLLAAGPMTAHAQEPPAQPVKLNIDEPALYKALVQFTQQAGLQLIFREPQRAVDLKAPKLSGSYTPEQALDELLRNSGFTYEFMGPRAVAIYGPEERTSQQRAEPAALRLSQSSDGPAVGQSTAGEPSDTSTGTAGPAIPEILVKGSKVLNMDIQRSRGDIQPYIVFDRATLERSGSNSIEEFLRDRLTAQTSSQSQAQTPGGQNTSSINLRGLGFGQTLILVDGHRIASVAGNGNPAQSDLNGIPMAAIERIEVLPVTASGIYGGGATGGAVNVILRRDYSGVESKLTYGGTFDGGAINRRVDVAAGFNFNDRKTSVLLAGNYNNGSGLQVGDRDFVARARAVILANNQGFYYNSASPPLGATTNIRSVSGNNLRLIPSLGGATFVSPRTFVPYGYAGPGSDNGAQLAANAGTYNFDLANTVQSAGGGRGGLLNTPEVKSASATVRHEFAPWLNGFLDLATSKNSGTFAQNLVTGTFLLPAGAAGNPFTEAVRVTTPAFGTDQEGSVPYYDKRIVGGLIFKLPLGWLAEVHHTWDRSRYSAMAVGTSLAAGATSDVRTGAIDVFRDTNVYPVDFSQYMSGLTSTSPTNTTLQDTELRFSGPLGISLPGGAPTVTVLLEHRREAYDDFTIVSPDFTSLSYARQQEADSVYLETRVPLVSERNALRGMRALELQLAARRDDYTLTGANQTFIIPGVLDAEPATRLDRKLTSTDPTVGLSYQPLKDITFRASYGTGFFPPSLAALVPSAPFTADGASAGLTDPRRGNEPIGLYTELSGGNPNLRPEESTSRSAGLIVTPRFTPGLRLSVDWTRIEKRDNITILPLVQNTIDNELNIPGYITRGPASDGYPVGPIETLNGAFINVAHQEVQAYDATASYTFETALRGTFAFSLDATKNKYNRTQVLPDLPVTERVGTSAQPELLAAATVDWEYGNWNLGWSARYIDSYWLTASHAVNPNLNSATIGSQTYHNLMVRYDVPQFGGGFRNMFSGVEVQAGVKNIFNRKPPMDLSSQFYSNWGDPRMASYYLSLKKNFDLAR